MRAQGERAARAQSVHDTQAARLRSLSVGPSPICDLAFEKSPGGQTGEPARSTFSSAVRCRNILGILHHLQGFGASFAFPRLRLAQLVVAVVL